MKVIEYLRTKYGTEIPCYLTKAEAHAFGERYPLVSGWLKRIGDKEITAKSAAIIKKAMTRRLRKKQKLGKMAGNEKRALAVFTKVYLRSPKPKPEAASTVDPVIASDAFLNTYEWRRVRMEAIKKYGARCQCCGAVPGNGIIINVDHIKPRRLYPDLALDITNLQILCNVCNHGKGNWDMTDWRSNAQEAGG